MTPPAPLPPDPDDAPQPAQSGFARALEEFERGARPAAAAAGAATPIAVGMAVRGTVVAIGLFGLHLHAKLHLQRTEIDRQRKVFEQTNEIRRIYAKIIQRSNV